MKNHKIINIESLSDDNEEVKDQTFEGISTTKLNLNIKPLPKESNHSQKNVIDSKNKLIKRHKTIE